MSKEKEKIECCDEKQQSCCNFSRAELSALLRHIADFFDKKN